MSTYMMTHSCDNIWAITDSLYGINSKFNNITGIKRPFISFSITDNLELSSASSYNASAYLLTASEENDFFELNFILLS